MYLFSHCTRAGNVADYTWGACEGTDLTCAKKRGKCWNPFANSHASVVPSVTYGTRTWTISEKIKIVIWEISFNNVQKSVLYCFFCVSCGVWLSTFFTPGVGLAKNSDWTSVWIVSTLAVFKKFSLTLFLCFYNILLLLLWENEINLNMMIVFLNPWLVKTCINERMCCLIQ